MGRPGRIDLVRHLEYFVAIAEEGQVGQAADRLDMSQPPLSQGLARLEARLGATLFDRHARGVDLTDAGRDLLPRARALLDAARAVLDPSQRPPAAVHLGITPQVPARMAAAVAAGLRHQTVAVTTAPTATLVARVAAGRLDVAVIAHPCVVAGVEAGEVVRLPRRALVPADQAVGDPVRLDALRSLTLAVPAREEDPSVYDLTADVAGAAGVTLSRHPVADDRAALVAAAGAGVMALTADDALGGPGVVSVALIGDPLPLRLRAIWSRPANEAIARRVTELLR